MYKLQRDEPLQSQVAHLVVSLTSCEHHIPLRKYDRMQNILSLRNLGRKVLLESYQKLFDHKIVMKMGRQDIRCF